jgi:tyrosine-protein kinase Etk/Wzc
MNEASEHRKDAPNLMRTIRLAVHYKKFAIGFPVAISVITAILLALMQDIYTATTRIMPPQTGQSNMFAAFGALANFGVGNAGNLAPTLGIKNPGDLYVGMLKGHTVADRIILRFRLQERYGTATLVDTRTALDKRSSVRTGRDGLIVVQVDDADPTVAASIANAYAQELDRLTRELAITEASQRRLFFEREMLTVREKLTASEAALRTTQEKTGLIQPEGQARAIFDALAALRATIAAKEVELASIRTFATTENPNYVRGLGELTSLRAQLDKLERAQPQKKGGNIFIPTASVPEVGLEYLRRVRELKYHEALHELLAKQYELAKIDEAKDAGLIQIVDKALPPDKRAKPERMMIFSVVLAASIVIVLLFLYVVESKNFRRQADPA